MERVSLTAKQMTQIRRELTIAKIGARTKTRLHIENIEKVLKHAINSNNCRRRL